MTDPLKNLRSELQKIQLTAAEKSDMRAELVRFMNEHPVISETVGRHIGRTRPFGWFVPFLTPRPMPALLALLLVVFTGGGVSLAANNALPGDLLYPVKVSVNEEVRSVFTFSDEAKLEFEIDRSERRLTEAERLDAEGELKSEAAAELAAQVKRHDETIADLETELQSRGQDDLVADLRSQYEARLLAYESLLYQVLAESRVVAVTSPMETLNVVAPEAASSVTPYAMPTIRLPDLIRELRQEVREQERGEGNETFRDEAIYSRDKAKQVLNRTTALIDDLAGREGRELLIEAYNKLEDAATFYNKGTTEFHAGRFAAAYAHLNNSIAFSNKAETLANQALADRERSQVPNSDVNGASVVNASVDFAITNIYLEANGELNIVQSNLAYAEYNALHGHTYIWIDDMNLPKWTYSWATLSNSKRDFLNPGGSSTIQPQLLQGQHIIKACIDALDAVREINESNNCLTVKVAVETPPQPFTEVEPAVEQPPVRRFQEILPGDEQYAPKAKSLRIDLEEELAQFEKSVQGYIDQWGKDDLIAKLSARMEDARIPYLEGIGYLESQQDSISYYWAYVNFNEGLRVMSEVIAEYNALVGSRTFIDDPADREMAPALDAHAKAIAQLKDAREYLEGLVKKLGERSIAEALSYLDQAEAAFSKADAQFERQDYESATENYLDAYEYARIAYDMGQKIESSD